jgi:flagellar motor switch protein FliN/FliY
MTEPATAPAAKSLLEEYAAEVGTVPTPEEAEAMSGVVPPPRRAATAELGSGGNLDMIMRLPVTVKVVLGSATMPVANLTTLGRGAVIALDRRVGDPVDVVVNGHIVARGEVVVVDEATSRFGISLTEVVGSPPADKGA